MSPLPMVKKSLLVVAAVLLLSFVSHTCAFGALFPWSPVKPGYAARVFDRVVVYYPEDAGLPPEYERADALLEEVAREARLPVRERVTVVVTDAWGLFNRGTLLGWRARPLPVLGAALQTGTVIYTSPLAYEPDRDRAALLKHELVHSLAFQQMALPKTFAFNALPWLDEGQAMLFSRSTDVRYMAAGEWRALAGEGGYRFSYRDAAWLEQVPAERRGLFRLAEGQFFVAFLMDRYGDDRFFRYRDRVLEAPERHEEAFRGVTGAAFAEAVDAFEQAVCGGAWPHPEGATQSTSD